MEAGIDAGGLLREYFTVLWEALHFNNDLFSGPHNARVLVHINCGLQNNDFGTIGKCIALSLMYGGSAPKFIRKSLVSYVFGDKIGLSVVDDIPNPEV